MKKLILPLLFFSAAALARTEICPNRSPSEVIPKVDAKVKLDNKKGAYVYQYTVSNLVGAKVPIWRFSIEAESEPVSIGSPLGWEKGVFDKTNHEIYWVYRANFPKNTTSAPDQKVSGFEIVSKKEPGIVKAYADGDVADTPIVKFDKDEDESDPDAIACPGFYNGEGNSDYVVTTTKGPAINNRLEVKIRAKRADTKPWLGSLSAQPSEILVSPVDYGQIDVIVFGSKAIDVNKIDYKSFAFGPGKAEIIPVKKVLVNDFKDPVDDEILKYLEKNRAQHMQLAFNLQEVEVRCNVDTVLFLTAKLGTKDLFGAVNVKPAECDQKTFAHEAQKDKYHKNKKEQPKDQ